MNSKLTSKIIAATLSLTLCVPVTVFACSTVNAASSAGITYSFSGSLSGKAGYAEGTISFKADAAANYKLYWADNNKALDGYYPIGELSMKSGETKSVSLGYHTAIPAGATKIIATTGSLFTADAYSVYDIPATKRLSYGSGNLLYTFSVYSDLHIDKRTGSDLYWKRSEANLRDGFALSAKKNADMVVISGDCATGTTLDTEWKAYQKILSQSDYVNPVWESNGNHDFKQDDKKGAGYGNKLFVTATGTDGSDSSKPYYYMVEKNTGDIFLFMALESGTPNNDDVFSSTQINWAKSIIDQYYNSRNIFLVEHAPVNGYGAGDRMSNPYYGGLMNPDKTHNAQFKQMLKDYPNVTFLSGHTHEDFSMDYNYFDDNGDAANMIHTPALAGSTLPKDDSSLNYFNGDHDSCQGYFVQVFENEIVFNGLSVTDELIFPQYSYIMEGARTSSSAVLNTNPAAKPLKNKTVDIRTELSRVAAILSKYYTYSSYDAYQYLKKLYYQYKDQTTADESVLDEFEERIDALSEYTGEIGQYKLYDTYYFVNTKKWSKVCAYAWEGSLKNDKWPGVQMTKYGVDDDGYDIYSISFNSVGEYTNIIFNNGSNEKQTVDISLTDYNKNGFYINGSSDGKYTVKNFAVETPVEELVNTSSLSADSVILGGSINVNASANGGAGDNTYSVCWKRSSNSTWVTAQDYSTNSTVKLKPTAAVPYDIIVKVKDKAGNIAEKSFKLNVSPALANESTVPEKAILGKSFTVNAKASGGNGGYTYAVYYKQKSQSSWKCKQDFSANTSVSIKPANATTYDVCVKVKDSGGKIEKKYFDVSVVVMDNTSTVSATTIKLGGSITVNCSAAGGSGSYKYAVYTRKNSSASWACKQSYSSNAKLTIKPSSASADYEICVKAKDSSGNEAKKYFTVPVTVIGNTSTVSSTSIKLGGSFTVNCSANGGSGSYQYAVYTRAEGSSSWSCKQSYSSNKTLSIKPAETGNQEVCVKAKDSKGNEAKSYFTVKVTV